MSYRNVKLFRERRRSLLRDKLGGVCIVCGTSEHLDFDHIDPSTKSFEIANSLHKNLDVLFEELAKCQLLCRSHHNQKTAKEKESLSPHNKGKVTHGKQYAAYQLKCNCLLCFQFKEQRNRSRRCNSAVE